MIALLALDLDPGLLDAIRRPLAALDDVRTIRRLADLGPQAHPVITLWPKPELLARAAALELRIWTWLFGEPAEDPLAAHRRGRHWLRVRLVELAPGLHPTARVLYEGVFKAHPLGPARTLARIWPVVADWPARVLAAGPMHVSPTILKIQDWRRRNPNFWDLLCAGRNLWLRMREATTGEEWRIGLLPRPPAAILERPTLDDAIWLPPRPGGGFWADPCGLETEAGRFVFVEDCPADSDLARLAVLRLDAQNRLEAILPVETDLAGHLSYPFVFAWNRRLWMLPEHSAGGHTVLLECVRFPDRWRARAELLSDFAAADPTLYAMGSRLWLFATERGNEKLHVFFADSLFGPWRPHPANPVVCDLRAARPAGPLFSARGCLWRPAQDCAQHYGSALSLCRIERLDEQTFAQTIVCRVPPPTALPDGAHTLAPLGRNWSVIDGKRHRRSLKTTIRRLKGRLLR